MLQFGPEPKFEPELLQNQTQVWSEVQRECWTRLTVQSEVQAAREPVWTCLDRTWPTIKLIRIGLAPVKKLFWVLCYNVTLLIEGLALTKQSFVCLACLLCPWTFLLGFTNAIVSPLVMCWARPQVLSPPSQACSSLSLRLKSRLWYIVVVCHTIKKVISKPWMCKMESYSHHAFLRNINPSQCFWT